MDFVRTKDDVVDNVKTFEAYLQSSQDAEVKFAKGMMGKGKTFLVYKVDGDNHFAPSEFLGPKKNTMKEHLANLDEDDQRATPMIDKVLKVSPFINKTIEEKFQKYIKSLGLKADNSERKYWRLKDSRGKNYDIKLEDID